MSFTLATLVASITVFVLAIFLGFELISKVPPTLHTPLMSGANAISGITIVGALILSNTEFLEGNPGLAAWLAFAALVMATINVVGGFMVTNRMLEMIAGKKNRKGGA
ncbi:MAG: pyridine nucleotide transhydrogenase [Euryarchaeota archaeon]|nr:pyridine nucleotide transhydrogenase [Euryarchaeota archaeon]|tara:strand:- start:2634 stop:2957 length:324 start_codon:yes stop_codon:yes gene_type:complete